MFMKFGKHKNQPIKNLPTNYIEWFCQNIPGNDDIKAEMQTVLLARWGGMKPQKQEPRPIERKRPRTQPETQQELFPIESPPMPDIVLVPWDGVSAPF